MAVEFRRTLPRVTGTEQGLKPEAYCVRDQWALLSWGRAAQ